MKQAPKALVLFALVVALSVVGCRRTDDEVVINPIDPTPEMEEAIAAANDSMTAALVATELTHSADRDTRLSAKLDHCPEITRAGASVTLDYGTGCVPDSGFLPGSMAGSVTLEVDSVQNTLTGTFTNLTYDGDSIDGTVTGSYTRIGNGEGIDLDETVDLTFNVGGTVITVFQDLGLNVRVTHVVVNGTMDYDDPDTMFDLDVNGVDFAYTDLSADCPLPSAGTITVTTGTVTVTIQFHEHSPDTGYATVTYGRISGDVHVCDYLGFL